MSLAPSPAVPVSPACDIFQVSTPLSETQHLER